MNANTHAMPSPCWPDASHWNSQSCKPRLIVPLKKLLEGLSKLQVSLSPGWRGFNGDTDKDPASKFGPQ